MKLQRLVGVEIALGGVGDIEGSGMEHDAMVEMEGAPIFSIADDRQADVGKLDADLMFATGLEFDVEELKIATEVEERLIGEDRVFAAWGFRRDDLDGGIIFVLE